MTTDEIRHLNIAQAVCERPRLFTPNGTLTEVIVFLAGCKYGMSTSYANDDSPTKVVDWILRDVMEDGNVEAVDRFATAIAKFDSTESGLNAIKQFAATINTQ